MSKTNSHLSGGLFFMQISLKLRLDSTRLLVQTFMGNWKVFLCFSEVGDGQNFIYLFFIYNLCKFAPTYDLGQYS